MLVLVGVAVAVIVSNSKQADTEQSGTATNENVLAVSTSVISSIEVTRADGTGIGFQGAVDDAGNTVWSLMDKYSADVPLNNNGITSWAFVLSNFMTDGTIGDSTELNLAEYGLANPVYTITITQFDGTVDVVYIGNKTAVGNDCYFMVEGDPNIYTVAAAKYTYCGYQLIDFLETVVFGIDYGALSTVEFKRASDGIDLIATCELYETGDPMFTAVSPFEIECSPYFVTFIDSIVNLEITSFVDIPDDQLADYGIEEPSYEFIFTMDDGRVVNVNLSSSIGGYYYGTSNVVDGYFKISELQVSNIDTQLMMLLSSYLVYYPATEMQRITGTYGDQSFTYEISTDGSISAEDAIAQLNSRDARVFNSDGRSYAAILYESLITISVSDVDTSADPEFDPVLEFEFITSDYEHHVLSFVQRDNNSYYAFLNGTYTYFIVPASELFNDSGSDTYNYGAWTAYELAQTAIENQIAGVYDIPTEDAA